MARKDSSENEARDARAKSAVKKEGNTLARKRSFVGQRAAILRSPDEADSPAGQASDDQGSGPGSEDDSSPPKDYNVKITDYHHRQRQENGPVKESYPSCDEQSEPGSDSEI